MDFKQVTKRLVSAFKEQKVGYALMGGFALGVWGVVRTTIDMDFLVSRDDIEKVHSIMSAMGYDLQYKTENVSQYVSSVGVFGEVDFLHAFREISMRMLKNARDVEIFNGEITIKVLRVEDIIGLKVQAIANDASRTDKDLADIEGLLAGNKGSIDWTVLQSYFSLFSFEELFDRLKAHYGRIDR